jgi:hypothetical protein
VIAQLVCAQGEGCANRGMHAPPNETGDGAFGVAGNDGSSGRDGADAGGGPRPDDGGAAGSSGAAGSGGEAGGTDGSAGTGGEAGTGGVLADGGPAGMKGAGGGASGGGTGEAGGGGAIGGAAGTMSGTGGAAGMGGNAGAQGSAGAGGSLCPLGGVLDCSGSGALVVPDGQVTDFSPAEWSSTTSQWCDPSGLRGHLFAFSGASPSAASAAVDTAAQNLKLNLTAGKASFAGGGIMFESCVNASAFTSVQFTATLTSGSLTGCSWQIQLQTQDQRLTTDKDPTGGTCSSNCERYPVVPNLALPGTTASAYTEAFTAFVNQTGSTIPLATQLTGVQWQINSANSGTGTCTVELRIDEISFR